MKREGHEPARQDAAREGTHMKDDGRRTPARCSCALAALAAALGIGACGSDDDDSGDGGDGSRRRRQDRLPAARDADRAVRGAGQAAVRGEGRGALPGLRDPLPERRSGSGQAAAAGRGRGDRGRRRDGPRPGRLDLGRRDSSTRAKQADIPVISYDRLILDADLDYYVAFDSTEVGEQQGEALSDKLDEDGNPEGPIVKINGDPKDNNAKLFKRGRDERVRGERRRDRQGVRHARLAARERAARDGAGDHGGRQGRVHGRLRGQRRHRRRRDRGHEGGRASIPRTIPVTGQDAELTGDPADHRRRAVHDGLQADQAARRDAPRSSRSPSPTARSRPRTSSTARRTTAPRQVPTVVTRDDPGDRGQRPGHDHRRRRSEPVDEICTGQYA